MKKKFSILYAVFACLILATTTIGTTYAYWVATTQSGSNNIKTASKTYSISMEITPLPQYTGFSFIPMNDEDVLKALKHECKDKYDRGACSAYKIRVYGYATDLKYITGTMDITTNNMENLSYMILEETETYDEDNCVEIDTKYYCISKEATHMGDGKNLSFGKSYDVDGLSEKNLLLTFWLTNLNENQNLKDIGDFNATVTISAGDGGKIKGTIASAMQIDLNSTEPIDNNDNTGGEQNP